MDEFLIETFAIPWPPLEPHGSGDPRRADAGTAHRLRAAVEAYSGAARSSAHLRPLVPPCGRRAGPDPVSLGARVDSDDRALSGMQAEAPVRRERSAGYQAECCLTGDNHQGECFRPPWGTTHQELR